MKTTDDDEPKPLPTTRLPFEGVKAYEAWRCYAEMGEKRSNSAVARKLRKSVTIINRWSGAHHWQDRMLTWHAEEAARESDAREKARLATALKREERIATVQEDAWEMARALFDKAREMLAFPVSKRTVTGENGETITVHPMNSRFGDVARVAETADQLSRIALGMPQKTQGLSGPGGEPLPLGATQGMAITVTINTKEKPRYEFAALPEED